MLPRVKFFTIGKSEEGRDIVMIAIADEAGIRNLEQIKTATATLADPRKADAAAAEKLIASGRPVYYLNAGLHSDETGSTESVLELAYRLAVSEQPMIRQIREKLVVLINPVCNPDGRDKVTEWFYTYLKGKRNTRIYRGNRRRTGRSMHSWISIATHTSRRTRLRARCTGCFTSGIRRWCTICMKRCRC